MENDIYIEMKFESIYNSAICNIKCTSKAPFQLSLPNRYSIISVPIGDLYYKNNENNYLKAEVIEGRYIVNFEVIGFMKEKVINKRKSKTGVEYYGMQYFPFISSGVKLKIKFQGGYIRAISIIIPNEFRVIFYRREVLINGRVIPRMEHALGSHSSYVFPIDFMYPLTPIKKEAVLIVNLPMRMAGKELVKNTIFPIVYFITSILTLDILFSQDKIDEARAVIVVFIGLMIERFNNAAPPQFRTVLINIYLLFFVILCAWFLFFKEYHKDNSFIHEILSIIFDFNQHKFTMVDFWLILLLIISIFFVLLPIIMMRYFSKEGELPKLLAVFFYKMRVSSDIYNKE